MYLNCAVAATHQNTFCFVLSHYSSCPLYWTKSTTLWGSVKCCAHPLCTRKARKRIYH